MTENVKVKVAEKINVVLTDSKGNKKKIDG